MPIASDWTVNKVGFDYRHPPEFCIDRPGGSGDFLMLYFTVPVLLHDLSGTREHPSDTCILYGPGFKQWYRGAHRQGLANHWCHFGGHGAAAWVKRCRLAVNRATQPVQLQALPPLFHALEREFLRREPCWHEACIALTQQILIAFARGSTMTDRPATTPRLSELAVALRDLRAQVHRDLERRWTIPEMARRVHLSPSRFAHLYRRFFGASPLDDLIAARIERARWLLSSGTVSVKEAAAESGFTDLHYFSRCFRRRVGCAPSRYDRSSQAALMKAM